jgi:hypothetical protein
MNERIRKAALILLNDLTKTAHDQLQRSWQRRDVSDEDAIKVRHEMLALQRVELSLTKLIAEVQDE